METSDVVYDAVVIGSGLTGSFAAKELAERGLTVLLLEKGAEFVPPDAQPFQASHEKVSAHDFGKDDHEIQKGNYSFNAETRHLFNNDRQTPYRREPAAPFNWIRTDVVGGRSHLWAAGSYRWSDLDFGAATADGHGADWPLRYSDLSDWYSHAERFMGISGHRDGLPHLPDGEFLRPLSLSPAEQQIKRALEQRWDDRTLIIGRTAVLTEPHGGRAPYAGPGSGSILFTPAHYSAHSAALPAALRTGRVTMKFGTLVDRLHFDEQQRRLTGVSTIDTVDGTRCLHRTRLVFLCASTIASTQILLQSACNAFPNGMANSSGVLGHYLMDHFAAVCAVGVQKNRRCEHLAHNEVRPTVSFIPRFRNLRHAAEEPYLRGYCYIGWENSVRTVVEQGAFPALTGRVPRDQRDSLAYTLMGFGENLPSRDNTVSLDPTRLDRYGQPMVRIRHAFGDNERRMHADMVEQAGLMLAAAGFDEVVTANGLSVGGDCVHEMGTARMGKDPRQSVLDRHNAAHDVPNLFVTDGACMVTSSSTHPSLTYMALTARAVNHAVRHLGAIGAHHG